MLLHFLSAKFAYSRSNFSKYGRRFTNDTSGCILRISEAQLHLFPSSCIGNRIGCDLNVTTPLLLASPNARFAPEIKYMPVLYVRKFSYIGADGSDILGSPSPIRLNKSIKDAIEKRIQSLLVSLVIFISLDH